MNLVKPLVVLGSGGTLVTGAYLTKDHWMPSKEKAKGVKSIADALKGKRLISSLEGDALTKQWESEFESDKDAIRLLLGGSSPEKQNGGVELSKWCSSKMSLDADKNEDVLKNVEKYCLIRSVASQLGRNKKTLLKEGQTSEWKVTYNKRKSTSSARTDVELTGSDWNNEQQDIDAIKIWCSVNSEVDFLASQEGTNSVYTKVLKGCTVDGAKES